VGRDQAGKSVGEEDRTFTSPTPPTPPMVGDDELMREPTKRQALLTTTVHGDVIIGAECKNALCGS